MTAQRSRPKPSRPSTATATARSIPCRRGRVERPLADQRRTPPAGPEVENLGWQTRTAACLRIEHASPASKSC